MHELWIKWEKLNEWEPETCEGGAFKTLTKNGCPFDCGLCPNHLRKACFVVMEVTNKCNLNCPICFANANMSGYDYEPDLETVEFMYESILNYECGCSAPIIQISGGEPTIREDLPEIISLGKEYGFRILLNTNGIRIAEDFEYLKNLKGCGLDAIYMQFDGVSDDVYIKLRRRTLLDLKVKAIQNCAKAGVSVILVPTILKEINLTQVGEIVRFAGKWTPTVKGVMFQPISYFGRYPRTPSDKDRITIPDMLKAIEHQTAGMVKMSNFLPIKGGIGCEAHCGFACLTIVKKNELTPITRFPEDIDGFLDIRRTYKGVKKTKHLRELLTKYWTPLGPEAQTTSENDDFQYLSIAGMHFQDVWNIETRRLIKCCIHVVTPNGYLIPFCIFNITNVEGRTLYRDKYLNSIIVG